MSSPYELSSDWLWDDSWRRIKAAATRLPERERQSALDALRRIFPREWAATATFAHGAVGRQLTLPGRLSLLELGWAAVLTPPEAPLLGRLRDPREFFGADAELRASLFFRTWGASLTPAVPDTRNGRKTEFLANWESVATAVVEVKALQSSAPMEAAVRTATCLVFSFLHYALEFPRVSAHVEWNLNELFKSTETKEHIEQNVAHALSRIRGYALSETTNGIRVPIGKLCTARFVENDSSNQLYLNIAPFAPTAQSSFLRLRRRCNEALQQLAGRPELPGYIVLDLEADGLSRNALEQLSSWAAEKQQLAAVLVFDREYGAGPSMITHVHLIRGGNPGDLPAALPLERCERGHLHFLPLINPLSVCPAAFAF